MLNGFSISLLEKNHDRKSFCCEIDSLDSYFHNQAGQDSRKQISVTYVLYDQKLNKVAGYYTLSATTIELSALPEILAKKLPAYPYLPATLIGRLAIDVNYKKQGLGEILLIDALKRAHRASLEVASLAIVVDAINSDAEKFYKKYGFSDLSKSRHQLFLPMQVMAKL